MINKIEVHREIIQLFLAACNFMELAKRGYKKLDPVHQNIKAEDLSRHFDANRFTKQDEVALYVLSYLRSCAIGVSTIYESVGQKPSANDLYKNRINSKNKIDYLSQYLRDNVCHTEPEPGGKYENRQKYLNSLTLKELFENIKNQLKVCHDDMKFIGGKLSMIGNHSIVIKRIKRAVV